MINENNNPFYGDDWPPESFDRLMPGWWSARMMNDLWSFGLLMTTGQVLMIGCINRFYQDGSGTVWCDAEFDYERGHLHSDSRVRGGVCFPSPTSRTTVSINCSQVIAAFEMADT